MKKNLLLTFAIGTAMVLTTTKVVAQHQLKAYSTSRFDGVMYTNYDSTTVFFIENNSSTNLTKALLREKTNYPNLEGYLLDVMITPKGSKLGEPLPDSLQYRYAWDKVGGQYYLRSKTEVVLDGNGKVIATKQKNWNSSTSTWADGRKYIYTYDAQNRMTSAKSVNGGKVKRKYEYVYDGSGDLITEIDQKWDNPSTSLINDFKYIYTYNGSNALIEEKGLKWDVVNNAWVNNYHTQYYYDGNEKIIALSSKDWDKINTKWVNSDSIKIKTYASTDLLTEYRKWVWTAGSYWEPKAKNTILYTQNKKIAKVIEQPWNTAQSAWGYYSQTIYTYSGNQPIKAEQQMWSSGSSQFENDSRWVFNYNTDKQCTTAIQEDWNGTSWAASGTPGGSTNSRKITFYYEGSSSGLNAISLSDFTIYPNPTAKMLHVKMKKQTTINDLQIVDMQGKKVFTTNNSINASEITIPTQSFEDGIYFLKMRCGNQLITKKFIVKH